MREEGSAAVLWGGVSDEEGEGKGEEAEGSRKEIGRRAGGEGLRGEEEKRACWEQPLRAVGVVGRGENSTYDGRGRHHRSTCERLPTGKQEKLENGANPL